MDDGTNPPTDDMSRMALAPSSGACFGLASLPFDVAHMVVWDEQLSLDDVAALRLTCRALTMVTATRLFYRIAISKLNKDRDAFLAICHSPHLAQHVHEVEWLEICYDVDVFDRIGAPLNLLNGCEPEEDDTPALCRYFNDQAKASFWMTNPPSTDGHPDAELIEAARRDAVAEFRGPFMAAVDLLPNLHTFASRRMPSARVVNSDPAYRMTAGLFLRCPRPRTEAAHQSNDGLIGFLLPAMGRPGSTVTRLRWADESPGMSYRREFPPAAFDGLESLELCLELSPWDLATPPAHFETACARAAPTLSRLQLCLAHGESRSSPGTAGSIVLGPALALSPACNLRSLRLVSVQCRTGGLVDLVKAHAASLRHLRFESVAVGTTLVRQLAGLAALRLDSIEVVDDAHTMVCGRALARYINGEPAREDRGCACRTVDDDYWHGVCDEAVREAMKDESSNMSVATAEEVPLPLHAESDDAASESSSSSSSSEDSVDYRRRTGPKWAWGRYFPADESIRWGVYCFQVADSDPRGHATEHWKFTSRMGETACGADPLQWFDDWDVDAGDVEEATPYCEALRRFWCNGESVEMRMGSLASYLGAASGAWELIQKEKPPADAVWYDEELDPLRDTMPADYGRW